MIEKERMGMNGVERTNEEKTKEKEEIGKNETKDLKTKEQSN